MTETTTAAAASPPAPKPRIATAEDVLAEFRRRRDLTDHMSATSALYRDGLKRAWTVVIEIAERAAALTKVSEVQSLDRMYDMITRAEARVKAIPSAPTPGAQPEIRQGREDAYAAAVRVCSRAISTAQSIVAEEDARVLARERGDSDGEIRDWDGYPLVPMPGDAEVGDLSTLALFLGGDGTSFTGDLLRLIGKADPVNLNKLAAAYPRHVRAFLMWRACAPIPVRTLVALLNTTTLITERKL